MAVAGIIHRLRRPRYFLTIGALTFYLIFIGTHPDNTGPPPTVTVNRPHKPVPTVSPVMISRPMQTPAPTPYDKALNDRVAAVLDKRKTTSSGYNTGGRRTILEGDQGGAATREFGQQDGITFLDDNTMTGNVTRIKPFDPAKPAK